MRKQLLLTLPIVAIAFLFVTGCEKEKDPAPAKTKTELLSQATWKFSAATVGGTDVSAFLQTCQKDNILAFIAAGTGTIDEGTTKCNGADPQSNPFTWNFQSAETILFISATLFTGGSSTFTLVSLSETQLVVSQNVTVSGSSQNAVVTFIH
jgi:hypothetical protein